MARTDARLTILAEDAAARLAPHEHAFELCAFCPKMCRFACPVAEADAREAFTPWAKMSAPFLALRGGAPLAVAFETSWACTACGHCTDYCAHGNPVGLALAAVRAAGIAAGMPSPVTDAIVAAYRKAGNASGRDPQAARREKIPLALRDDGRSRALVLPGCSGSDDAIRPVVRILEKLGLGGVTIATDGACCGGPLLHAGRPDLFVEHARAFARKMAKRSVLVVADAGCAATLRALYPAHGVRLKPEVLHVSEWLARFFRERVLKARTKVKGAFLFHDPCSLARHLGVTEEPREVLAAILADGPREFAWNRRDTVCCGGGALLPRTMPETSARMATRRAAEAKDQRAAIVTSCTTCETRLKGQGVEVKDLLTLVADAI